MATKRKFELDDDVEQEIHVSNKKHTLDSDEEDSDEYEKDELHDSDIEGEEEGAANIQDEVKITPFNMREELEEGHFDTEGQYHWNKDADIKDNWLDNIDWVKVKTDKNYLTRDKEEDLNDPTSTYNEARAYTQMLEFMEPNETVQTTLQRLGKNRKKISSAERLRQKKLGIVGDSAEKIIKFTELTNEILTRTGNMDIYQESYAQILAKLNLPGTSKAASGGDGFDMYSDDFVEKEKQHLNASKPDQAAAETQTQTQSTAEKTALLWEYKWKQADTELHGPFTTEQMLKWTEENYFKEGVYVRKVGEVSNFYSSKRIDFDLYL